MMFSCNKLAASGELKRGVWLMIGLRQALSLGTRALMSDSALGPIDQRLEGESRGASPT